MWAGNGSIVTAGLVARFEIEGFKLTKMKMVTKRKVIDYPHRSVCGIIDDIRHSVSEIIDYIAVLSLKSLNTLIFWSLKSVISLTPLSLKPSFTILFQQTEVIQR